MADFNKDKMEDIADEIIKVLKTCLVNKEVWKNNKQEKEQTKANNNKHGEKRNTQHIKMYRNHIPSHGFPLLSADR
jgi:hypothetical protein